MTSKLDHIATLIDRGEAVEWSQVKFLLEVALQAQVVRTAQKRYFKEKGFANLDESRKQERALDKMLAENHLVLQESLLDA